MKLNATTVVAGIGLALAFMALTRNARAASPSNTNGGVANLDVQSGSTQPTGFAAAVNPFPGIISEIERNLAQVRAQPSIATEPRSLGGLGG